MYALCAVDCAGNARKIGVVEIGSSVLCSESFGIGEKVRPVFHGRVAVVDFT